MKKTVILFVMMFAFQVSFGQTSYLFDMVLVNNTYKQRVYAPEDVVYLLPGQRYDASYHIHLSQIGSGERSVKFLSGSSNPALPPVWGSTSSSNPALPPVWGSTSSSNPALPPVWGSTSSPHSTYSLDGFNLNWKNNSSGQESYFTEIVDDGFESSWCYFSSSPDYWLGDISFINTLKPGDSLQYRVDVVCQKHTGDKDYSYSHFRTVKCIDRIRGDVNDDGWVDYDDVDILLNQVSLYQERSYEEHGINLYAGCVLSSEPDMASITLIQIWINNPNDPRVEGLGIGELMSLTQGFDSESNSGPAIPPVWSNDDQESSDVVSSSFDLKSNSISVFPNPFTNQITITSDKADEAVLVNMQGQILKQFRIELGQNQFSLIDLRSGVYFVRTRNKVVKIVKQ